MNMISMNMKKDSRSGFTLLELLIVISIIAILSVALVLVLNPAEALKKSRDAQRISDLSTMKTALGLYMTSTSTPFLGGVSSNATCEANTALATVPVTPTKIFYSSATSITATGLDGAAGVYQAAATTVGSTNLGLTDGLGWIPINLDTLTGGSPISNLPIDPSNAFNGNGTGDSITTVTKASTFYRYACSITPLAFEMNAVMESEAYSTGSDNKLTTDGGNNINFLEVGTSLKILGTGNNF